MAGSFADLRFSSLGATATRLGSTHLDLDVARTAGDDALEAPFTEGDAARDALFTAGDGSRCLDGAGDENRRFTAVDSETFLGARTVLLAEASAASNGGAPLEPDGMSGGAALDGQGWMT